MSKELRSIVNAKKKVFREFCVEWNDDIEKKFLEEVSKHPNDDPEVIMDIVSHDALIRGINSFR